MKNRFLLPLLLISLFSSCGNNGPVDPYAVPLHFTCLSESAVVSIAFSFDELQHQLSEFLLESSKDNQHWSKVEPTIIYDETYYAEIPFNKNEKIYFRSDNHSYNDDFHLSFVGGDSVGEVSVGGNVMSLLGKTDFATKTVLPCDACFYMLFCENNDLSDASNLILPATTLTKNCYGAMFSGDPKLKTAPKLPATSLAESCYEDMFSGRNSLQIATTGDEAHKIFTCPEGGAICCDNMFDEDLIVQDNTTYYYL